MGPFKKFRGGTGPNLSPRNFGLNSDSNFFIVEINGRLEGFDISPYSTPKKGVSWYPLKLSGFPSLFPPGWPRVVGPLR